MPVCTSPHGAGYRHVCCHALPSKPTLAVCVLKRAHRFTPNPHVHAHSSVPEQCDVHAAPTVAISSAWIWVLGYVRRVACGYSYSMSTPCKVLDHFSASLRSPNRAGHPIHLPPSCILSLAATCMRPHVSAPPRHAVLYDAAFVRAVLFDFDFLLLLY